MRHPEIIRLVIAYTLVGAFVFTAIVTCLSLIDFIRFAHQDQQEKLFYVLVVELVAGSVGLFFNFLSLDPKTVTHKIEDRVVQSVDGSLALAAAEADFADVPTTKPADTVVEAQKRPKPASNPSAQPTRITPKSSHAPAAGGILLSDGRSSNLVPVTLRVDSSQLSAFRGVIDDVHIEDSEQVVGITPHEPHTLAWIAVGEVGSTYKIELLRGSRVIHRRDVAIRNTLPNTGLLPFIVRA